MMWGHRETKEFFLLYLIKSTCHAQLWDWKVIIRIKVVRNISVLSAHQWTKKKKGKQRKQRNRQIINKSMNK